MASGIYQMIERDRAQRVALDGFRVFGCPCCHYPHADLVDVAFVASTGTMVKTGDTHQCPVCYAYFVPGEGCENA